MYLAVVVFYALQAPLSRAIIIRVEHSDNLISLRPSRHVRVEFTSKVDKKAAKAMHIEKGWRGRATTTNRQHS